MTTEELWWGRTPNPARFQRDVLEQVELENSVVLNFPGDVPWRSVFISMLQNSLHQTSATRDFLVIEAPYERDPKKRMEPGEFILKNHCEQWDYDNYWPTQTYGQYLASKPVTLHQMYIYVNGIHRDECEAWFQFVRDYLESFPENAQHAVFLLEVQCSSVSGYRQLTFLNYQDYVSDYDGLMLCLAVTAPLRCSSTQKQYIAEIADHIAGENVEQAGQLADEGVALAQSPLETVGTLFADYGYNSEDLEKRVHAAVWEAQIKIIFPKMEQFRSAFIRKHHEKLMGVMPVRNSNGETIYEPDELELGTLYFICNTKCHVEQKDYEKLRSYREARNKLAHWDILSYEDMQSLGLL